MGTKRSNWILFGTAQSSSQNPTDGSHKQRNQTDRDPSPRAESKNEGERERERQKVEDWKSWREVEKVRERKRDTERERGQGPNDRVRGKVSQEREGKNPKLERAIPGEGERGANGRFDPTIRGAIGSDGGTFPRMGKTSREREERMGKGVERGDSGMNRLEGPRWLEMESSGKSSERERQAKRDRQRYAERDIQRYKEIERERKRERDQSREEWKRTGGRERKEGQLDPRRERENVSWDPRYRNRGTEEREETLLRRKVERERDQANYAPRERERGPEKKRIRDKERQNFSDREVLEEQVRGRRRDARSEGDSEAEVKREIWEDSERRRVEHRQSKSEGDNEGERTKEGLRERERDVRSHRERDWERQVEENKGRNRDKEIERRRERERESEGGREIGRQREIVPERERKPERREGQQRKIWREPETGKGETSNTDERRKHREKENHHTTGKKSEEDRNKQRVRGANETNRSSWLENEMETAGQSGREWGCEGGEERRRKGEKEPATAKTAESEMEGKEGGLVQRYKGCKPERERKQRREQGQDGESERPENRQMQRMMWIEPQRVTENREVAAEVGERDPDGRGEGYEGRNVEKGQKMHEVQEERFMEKEEIEETESEGSVEGERKAEDEDDTPTLKEIYGASEVEFESDGESEKNTQNGNRYTEEGNLSDSTNASGSELDTEDTEVEERERVLSAEDGFITVSSNGEEDEEKFEDCKDFWEGAVSNEEANRMEGEIIQNKEIFGEGEDLGMEIEKTEVETGMLGEEEENDRRNPKVTVFCVIGQTLPRTNQGEVMDEEMMETVKISEDYTGENSEIPHTPSADGEIGIPRNGDWEEKGRDIRKEESSGEEETRDKKERDIVESSVSDVINRKNLGLDIKIIITEHNDEKETGSFSEGGGNDENPENINETETKISDDIEKEFKTETEANSTDFIKEGEQQSVFMGQMSTNTESCPENPKKTQREGIFTEEVTPSLKWARDIVTEILGPSEENTFEERSRETETCTQTDTQTCLDQSIDDVKGSPTHATVQKTVWMDTQAQTEMSKDAQLQRKTDGETESEAGSVRQTFAGGGMQTISEQEKDTKEDQDESRSIIKAPLSKNNSCPSPVNSPSKDLPRPAMESDDEGEAEEEREKAAGSSFRDYGNDARVRRRGIRKSSERGKEEGEAVGRDRRPRIFNLSDEEDVLSASWSESELRKVTDTVEITKRRKSKFFNSQLYQQYSEVVQNREILRQAHSDTLSLSEDVHGTVSSSPPVRRPLPPLPPVPHPHSISHFNYSSSTSTASLPLPPIPQPPVQRVSVSLAQSPTLWQELPGVRNSRELNELTEDERRLQEVRFEVVTSEASYCRSIDIVVEHFVKSKQLGALLTTQDRNWLFSRLGDVRAVSHSFLSKLEERVETNILHFSVCDIIIRHCPRFRSVYVPYLTNQSYQDKTYQRLMEECPGFRRTVENLERNPICQRLPFRSFLILPFQRITRLKLLVQNLVKRTAPNTEEATLAIKALKMLEKLIQESNDSITQMKSIESLVLLSAKVDFECKTLPLVSQSRRLVREGSVTELRDSWLKEVDRMIHLHLFNDYLLVSLQKEGGRFTVVDHAPVAEVRVENLQFKLHSLQKNLFRVHLSQKALVVRTETQSDKLRWLSALSRPHPEIDYSAAQELPQVQCIRAFVAQHPDEITLEKADVLLVHQHSDGWIEGTRLSDRQRGWAPEAHLETIVSSRARQRNLLETQKITTATATHQESNTPVNPN